MCKVSAIVPVYNGEKYLRACLESLTAQTLEDIEVIIVNDGSTDGSLAIAEEFAASYDWFRVFSTENRGVSHARNYGAEQSGGEYLAFVDSDDEVEPNYCRVMYEKAMRDSNDVVMCRIEYIKRSNGQIKHTTSSGAFWEEDNFRLVEHPKLMAQMSTSPFNKLVRRELFFKVRFPEDISYAEDISYTVRLFCLAENIGTEKQILYHYYRVHNGVTSRFGSERLTQMPCMEQIQRFMENNGLNDLFHLELGVLYLRLFDEYLRLLMPHDGDDWDIRLRFVHQTQTFLKEYCPNWRRNPYYRKRMRERAKRFRPVYYNYGKTHMLLLLYLSRFLPAVLYKQILRADHVLVYLCRRLRWTLPERSLKGGGTAGKT